MTTSGNVTPTTFHFHTNCGYGENGVTFTMWLYNARGRASARRAFVVEKYIHFYLFFKKMIDHFIRPLFLGWDRAELFEAALKLQFGPSTRGLPLKSIIWRKILGCFPQKPYFRLNKERHELLGWHEGWVNYQEIFILEVNESFKFRVGFSICGTLHLKRVLFSCLLYHTVDSLCLVSSKHKCYHLASELTIVVKISSDDFRINISLL